MDNGSEVIQILLAEDNPDHIMITKKALKEAGIVNTLAVVRDGQEVMDYLRHSGPYVDKTKSPKPGLILMDINMPKLNGIEALKQIKVDEQFRRIPVVMLTMSKRDEDVVRSFDSGANSFIQKPVEFDKFVEVVRQVGLYWGLLNVNRKE